MWLSNSLVCPFITNVDSRWMHHFPRLIDSIKQYQVMTDTGQPLRKSLIWLDMGVKKSHYFVLKLYKVQYASVSVHQSKHVVKLPLQSLFLLKITARQGNRGSSSRYMPSEISQILLRLAPIKITDHWEYQSATHGRDLRTWMIVNLMSERFSSLCI